MLIQAALLSRLSRITKYRSNRIFRHPVNETIAEPSVYHGALELRTPFYLI